MVTKQSAVQIASNEIVRFLKEEKLKPGDKLPPEVEMSRRLGISRATLREVYHQLQASGYIDLINGRGAFAAGPKKEFDDALYWFRTNEAKLKDYLEVRLSIDPLAARLAAQRKTEDDIVLLRNIEQTFEEAISRKDNVGMADKDAEFHARIVQMTGNELLIALEKIINHYFEKLRQTSFLLEQHANNAIKPHRAIMEAIARGDYMAAERESSAHMRQSLHDLCGVSLPPEL